MAAKNLVESKRFVYRSSDNKQTEYLVPINKSQSHVPSQISQPPKTPARRVMVIRNTKHAEINQKTIDLGDFEQANLGKIPPKTPVYFIRRSIAASDPPKSLE